MLPKPEEQEKARSLRQQGLSIRAITKKLGVAQSSVSLWVEGVELSSEQAGYLAGNGGRSQRKTDKSCPLCGTTDLTRFGVNKARWDGLQTYCKTCVNAYRKPRNKTYSMKHRYDLPDWNYERYLAEQGGVCALCGDPPESKPLVADHNHATEKFRGLVHSRCNMLLGAAKDQPRILRAAIQYLAKNSTISSQLEGQTHE